MTERLNLSTYNVNKGLSINQPADIERRQGILDYVEQNPADVHVFIEAYGGIDETLNLEVKLSLQALGYVVGECRHNDTAREAANPTVQKGVVYATKLPIQSVEAVNFDGERDLPLLRLKGESGDITNLLIVHLDDRTEYGRWKQTRGIIDYFGSDSSNLIIIGDLNSMPKRSPVANVIRSTEFAHEIAGEKNERIADLLKRLSYMAIGGAHYALVHELQLTDADPTFGPTITAGEAVMSLPKSLRSLLSSMGDPLNGGVAQLDHVLYGSAFEIEEFKRHLGTQTYSDHIAIQAVLRKVK